jgi:hypothetical protein
MSAVASSLFGAATSFAGDLFVIPPGQIGAISIQATLEETLTDLVTVTDHPVEAGAQISDHAYYRPAELVMRCGWSNSTAQNLVSTAASLFSQGGLTVSDYVSGIYAQLLSLQQSLQPFTVLTSIRQYTNMMLTSIALQRDQRTSQALMVTATMRQVIIVSTVSTTLAPIQNQATPANTAENIQTGQQQPMSGVSPNPAGSPGPSAWPPGQQGT